MTQPPNPETLVELRELLAKATLGPWWHPVDSAPHAVNSDPHPICTAYFVRGTENAALIVAAVNTLPALLDHLDQVRGMLTECVIDLENEIDGRYAVTEKHPAMARKYQRDMEPCRRARALLGGGG